MTIHPQSFEMTNSVCRNSVADVYPQSKFDGMDLSPIQPDWVPENVIFVVDDIEHESGWTYPPNKFDYIHIRHTIHSIKDRPQMWRRIFKYVEWWINGFANLVR
jgi:hypothetical protein